MSGRPAGYFPALDGLRLVCCAMVVVGHCVDGSALAHRAAAAGVDLFFSLSGFLITWLLLRERETLGSISLKAFFGRRALRILPVYLSAVLLACAGIAVLGDAYCRPLGVARADVNLGVALLAHLLFVANLVELTLPATLKVLWSVCIEEQFYLVFPTLIRFSRLAVGWLVLGGISAAWLTRAWLVATRPDAVYHHTLAHADHLLLGAGVAALLSNRWERLQALLRRGPGVIEFGLLGLVLMQVVLESLAPPAGIALWASYAVSAALGTCLIAVLASGKGAVSALLSTAVARRLGQLTYAGYAFHYYAVVVAWRLTRPAAGADASVPAVVLRMTLALVGTFLIAEVSRRLLEQPFLKMKGRFERNLRTPVIAVGAAP